MKKLLIASLASVSAFCLVPGVALAEDSISNTGPGSYNSIINEETNEVTVTCNNSTEVINDNGQVSSSGSTTVDGNGYGGNAQSGDATNLNEFVAELGISCVEAAATTTPPPTEGGKGGETPQPAPAVEAASTELPDTGASMVVIGAATAFVLGTASAMATKKLLNDEN